MPAHSCTCPVGAEQGFCKHCVAVGLALAGDEGRTSKEPEEAPVDLREYLRSAEKEQLIDLLLEHATEDELLRGRLLVDAAGARDSVDAAGYRWTIEDVFNPSEYVDWRSVYADSSARSGTGWARRTPVRARAALGVGRLLPSRRGVCGRPGPDRAGRVPATSRGRLVQDPSRRARRRSH